jgi:hypothetical protein
MAKYGIIPSKEGCFMYAFFGLIGFVGVIVCVILLVINAIRKKPLKNTGIGLAVFLAIFVIAFIMTPTGTNEFADTDAEEVETEPTQEELNSRLKEEDAAEEPTEQSDVIAEGEIEEAEEPVEEKTQETLSQKNAVGKANDYLKMMAFSKSGLVKQLEFEGFDNEDATYAVNKIDVDWKEQAVRKGEEYLNIMSYSRSGLIEQLEFEGFTTEEATYAVDQIGL